MDAVDRIDPQPWMTEPATAAVLGALARGGVEARFVGGCVRDALLGRAIVDIDLATPAPPQDVTRLLSAARFKVVPTGLKHGTLTAVVPPRHFEITTLRRDVENFGRHAKVAFTDDWAEDARRRDFTMNALFLDQEGRVFDPVGGLPDLRAGRVRFVGDAEQRIREDVLRLLRFYRFHAHYGRGEPDAAARAACRKLAPLLPGLSGERVQAELLKLLGAPDPVPTLRLMVEDGVLAVLLPEAARIELVGAVAALEPERDRVRRLAALLTPDRVAALAVSQRLRVSNEIRDRLVDLADPAWPVDLDGDARAQRRALRHLGLNRYRDLVVLRGAETGAVERARALFAEAPALAPPDFPIKGRDVTRLGLSPGPKVGRLLREVEEWWEAGDFRADRAACLARLKELSQPR
jgi:poly(A) polymerase